MNKQQINYTTTLLGAVVSTTTCFIKAIYFILNPTNSNHLFTALLLLAIASVMWFYVYYLKVRNSELTDFERKKANETLIKKLPLILLSIVITGIFSVLYFFFFAFLTVSTYDNGGVGAKASIEILFLLTFTLVLVTSYFIIKPVLETEESDISLTIYNLFSKLKWTALIILPFGFWSTYYFYHSQGFIGFLAMIVWDLILYGVYQGCNKLAKKVQEHITEANVNRILHEKKKQMIERNK